MYDDMSFGEYMELFVSCFVERSSVFIGWWPNLAVIVPKYKSINEIVLAKSLKFKFVGTVLFHQYAD